MTFNRLNYNQEVSVTKQKLDIDVRRWFHIGKLGCKLSGILVSFSYSRGKTMNKALIILGEVWNFYPNTEYTLVIKKNGKPDSNINLYEFMTDRHGNAALDGECEILSNIANKSRKDASYMHLLLTANESTEEVGKYYLDALKEQKKKKRFIPWYNAYLWVVIA